MKKWITAGLVVMLLAALAFSLSLYLESQRLNQEVNSLQRQHNLETDERNRQATAAVSRRSDLVSTINQQKDELEKIQKLLDSQKETTNRLAQNIGTVTPGLATSSATAQSGADQYQSDIDAVRKDLLDLRSIVDKLKQYAADLEKNLNLPAPELLSTPQPTSTPLSLKSTGMGGMGGNPNNLNPFNGQLMGLSQDLTSLGDEVQGLLQRYTRLQTVATTQLVPNNVSTGAAPTFVSAVSGAGAVKLAQLSYAPKGWPVNGPVTSTFGPRPNIFSGNTKTSASPDAGDGKGGYYTAPTVTAPQGTPIRDMATVTALVGGNLKPADSPTTQPTTTTSTPGSVNTTPAASPTATTKAPEPTATATFQSSPTPAPSATTGPATPTTAANPSPSPTTTFSAPVNGPAVSSSSIQVGPGMEFHSGIDIGVPEGTSVHATASGVVEYAGDQRSGYGNVVYINHPGGFITIYGHNSRLLVTPGQSVKAGDVIALSGNTGYSSGPHVHYEIRYQSQVVDPVPFMQ